MVYKLVLDLGNGVVAVRYLKCNESELSLRVSEEVGDISYKQYQVLDSFNNIVRSEYV